MRRIKRLVGMSIATVVVLSIVSGIITVSVTAMPRSKVPVAVVYSGHGFVLNGDEFHVLSISPLPLPPLSPQFYACFSCPKRFSHWR